MVSRYPISYLFKNYIHLLRKLERIFNIPNGSDLFPKTLCTTTKIYKRTHNIVKPILFKIYFLIFP